jgi:hypothetical protein
VPHNCTFGVCKEYCAWEERSPHMTCVKVHSLPTQWGEMFMFSDGSLQHSGILFYWYDYPP